jgi:hypothetical protein
MLVSFLHRFIYLKTRKTGSTAAEIFFERYCYGPEPYPGPEHYRLQSVTQHGIIGRRGEKQADERWYNHMPARLIRARLGGEQWDQFLKFCVIRNPYEETVSAFWYFGAKQLSDRDCAGDFEAVRKRFTGFVSNPANIVDNRPIYMLDGRLVADVVLRHERLAEDVAALALRLGLPDADRPLGRYKSSYRKRSEPFQAYYTPETAAMVEAKKAVEFELFGYPKLEF